MKSAPVGWMAKGCSVRGASHERNGKPNQDHWDHRALPEGGAAIAVADGHGSAKYFRSGVGSQLAVEVVLNLITEMMEGVTRNDTPLDKVKANVEGVLPRKIVEEWRRRVGEHWNSQEKLTDAEAEILKNNPDAHEAVESDYAVAYGCTLLAAAVTARYLVLVQNGDGDIVCVSRSGKASLPMGNDPRLIANETTSLCQPHTEKNFRVVVQELGESAPALVTLSSDGCANSYEDDEFLRWVEQFALQVSEYGLGPVSEQLKPWLEQMTRGGSGDDVTLSVLALEGTGKPTSGQDEPIKFQNGSSPGLAGEESLPTSTTPEISTRIVATKPLRQIRGPLALVLPLLGVALLALAAFRLFQPKQGISPPVTGISQGNSDRSVTPVETGTLNIGEVSRGDEIYTQVSSTNTHVIQVSSANPHVKCEWHPEHGSTGTHLSFNFDESLPLGPMKDSITFSFGKKSKVTLTILASAVVRKKDVPLIATRGRKKATTASRSPTSSPDATSPKPSSASIGKNN